MRKSREKQLHALFKKETINLPVKIACLIWKNIKLFLKSKSAKEVVNINYFWAKLLRIKDLKNSEINSLSLATAEGWIAYSIIDDINDKNNGSDLLAIANIMSRLAFNTFRDCEVSFAARNHKVDKNLCLRIFNMVDQSCYIESLDKKYFSKRLINKNICLEKTFKKSIGYALGPILITYYFCGVRQQKYTYKFFKNYITARQLHDDGLDWKEDIIENNLTMPLRFLLAESGYKNLKHLQPTESNLDIQMIQIYTKRCLPKTYKLINSRLDEALLNLQILGKSPDISNILDKLRIKVPLNK